MKLGKNGTYKNISESIQKVSVTGRTGDAPRTLSATLFDSEQFARASANSGEGNQLVFFTVTDHWYTEEELKNVFAEHMKMAGGI